MRWLVNNTVIKILVVVLCIKEIWLLLGVPSISNAIIQFCTIGLIPGTSASLTPLEMVIVSIVASILLFSILFRKELKELFIQHGIAVHLTQEQSQPMPIRPSRFYRQHQQLLRGRNWASATLEFWFWSIVVILLEIARAIVSMSVILWQAAEPYIRQFDHWLDVQLHSYEPAAKALTLGSDILNSSQLWLTKAKVAYTAINASRQINKSDQHSS